MENWIFLTVLLPLIGFLINGALYLAGFSKKQEIGREMLVGGFSATVILVPFFILLKTFLDYPSDHDAQPLLFPIYQWIEAGGLDISITYRIDSLSLLMGLVVTGVGSLIHIYSIGYMHGDKDFARFFSYLNLFIFAMMNLILAESMPLMFLGWEGVGLCSYLLIGFWYDKKFDGVGITWTGNAANKAFIVNRIGDFAMLIAMFLIFQNIGRLDFTGILSGAASLDAGLAFWITLLIFIGSTGKSAQIPLFVWLPDAMAGPTPVSALIHAATMVTSGIYLIARLSPLFLLAPETMHIIAVVGTLTAIMAGTIGIVQNDIKKVLAYSTVSQLGYMFLALGIGAFSTAIFHVATHAFFKACLFLGSGSVIHGMHEEQDIRKMGGLFKKMPSTAITFLIATFALAGFPLTAGFFSKDAILAAAFGSHNTLLYGVGVLTAVITAFYSMRLYTLTFLGNPRWSEHAHPHESPAVMTLPLWVLAALSLVGGFIGLPPVVQETNWIDGWLHSAVEIGHFHLSHETEWLLIALSGGLSIVGLLIGYFIYSKKLELAEKAKSQLAFIYQTFLNKYYIDELYEKIVSTPVQFLADKIFYPFDKYGIDGTVNGTGTFFLKLSELFRKLQDGATQSYALTITIGIVIITTLLVLKF
ncbi:proton-translocating NADH-quinone oxidoreductase, chain L [Chloroherpeton thalassium ATCC 35110]|uniref:Proton-translocating NADH-quinone oxidoreductase, chain L n=1 Tax=Chloroherpeton thalassium (strain ATCC 35110 / GB-78) TaxID=517418 RepID=B3QXL9_CHLT3|nr:NADH-quinone oxidoreductase subunit L [Chloroherpeton thalassium]ACF14934.1 proton-translocating NADH-quinone oxidoreductase, chain L [Chloroherpeton thalassium ATCC 35110]